MRRSHGQTRAKPGVGWVRYLGVALCGSLLGLSIGGVARAQTGAVPLPAAPVSAGRSHLALAAADDPQVERASRLKAIGASLLLPGLGHRATGHAGRGRIFMVAEAAIVIGVVASEVQGYVRKQGYIDFAEELAGVADADGRADWYYRNLGQYRSSDDYVDDIAATARALYGDDLAARDAYVARNRPTAAESWRWRSDSDRREFRERRKASRNAYRRASLFLGAALFDRLLSAVDAARLAGKLPLRSEIEVTPEGAIIGLTYAGDGDAGRRQ